jgi:hypothetical protein
MAAAWMCFAGDDNMETTECKKRGFSDGLQQDFAV